MLNPSTMMPWHMSSSLFGSYDTLTYDGLAYDGLANDALAYV